MKKLILLLVMLTPLWSSAQGESATRAKYIVNFRAGPMLTPLDPEVDEGHWDHNKMASWGGQVGFYFKGYPRWRSIHFFIGPDAGYLTSQDTRGDAKIESSFLHLSVMAGAAYQPQWLGGNIGFQIAPSYKLWSEAKSTLSTPQLDIKLNEDRRKFQTGWQFAAYYQVHSQWQALVSLENIGGRFGRSHQLNFGVNHAF